MERVFYFSGYRMTVFDWDGKTLFGSRDFQPDDAGFHEFEKLLKSSVSIPSRLLVDMIEEDFRRETIPHVNRFDRGALIQRQLERHYREEDYVHARLIGRTNVGRRDDQILMSALTNTGLLAPWLDRLEQYDVLLAGIWSLPLLSEKLVKSMRFDHDHVLVVSRQVRSSLRNSYLHKGKLMISRQAKFDKDMWDNDDFDGVITNLERSTLEIYNFMVNQRMMGGDDKLKVYFLVQANQVEQARQLITEHSKIQYECVSLESTFEQFGLQGCEEVGSAALFSYLCSQKNSLYDHYGKKEQKANYYRHLIDDVVENVTQIGSLLFVAAAVMLALKGMELDLQHQNLTLQHQQLEAESEARFGGIRSELASATYIAEAVKLVDQVSKDASQAPHQYFGVISEVLGQPDFRAISLLEMEWQKYPQSEVQRILREHRASLESKDPNVYIDPYELQNFDEEVPSQRQSILSLRGDIDTNGLSYRETIDTMNQFVRELAAMDQIDDVILVRTAADIRETSRFTDQIRGEQTSTQASSGFEILVVVGGSSNA